jgi:pimeloyl-ACP methyl ester carboxylesterase
LATFVLVHGAFGGAWEWRRVARLLQTQGHETFTVTLTGLGERSHLLHQDVGLSTHVEDVCQTLALENLESVILCGHSYGGMVVTGVVDRMAVRIANLVYIDAMIPVDGQSVSDLFSDELAEALWREPARTCGEGWRVPSWQSDGDPDMSQDTASWYSSRVRAQSLLSFEQPIRLDGMGTEVPRTYIQCGEDPIKSIMRPFGLQAIADGWAYRELHTSHDAQVTDPEGVAGLLCEIANTFHM